MGDTTGLKFSFKAELKDPAKTVTVRYPEDKEYADKIEVKNFTTETVGTRTATVVFEKLTLAFSYKVTDKKFADGTGSSVDPYISSRTCLIRSLSTTTNSADLSI